MKYIKKFFPWLYCRTFHLVIYTVSFLSLTQAPCLPAEGSVLKEEVTFETQRLSLSHIAVQPQPFTSGGPINCLFWGPYLHMDYVEISPEATKIEPRLPARLGYGNVREGGIF